ncbi:MAG: PAS domain-containing protein [Gammaproteobacteria bacterium]|nr:PAS domain-containing protein [Gammaproteobacteria bacterium]
MSQPSVQRTPEFSRDLPQHLSAAFDVFNQISQQLAVSYQDLENRVARLGAELAAARSEQINTAAEKERLANRLQTLLDALPGGVVVLDGAGYVQLCNPAALDLLGTPLQGMLWRDVIARAFAPRSDDGHEVSLRDGRRVGISTSSLAEEPGQILLVTDLSETRALQEKLSRHQRLSAMGEMAASLAHQIRTPLSSAVLYASHLSRTGLKADDQSRFAEKILFSLRHIEKMVNDMLMFVRGGGVGDEDIAVTDLLDAFQRALEPQLQACAGRMEVIADVAGLMLRGNRDALLGALLNLATNAIQACGMSAVLRLLAVDDGEGALYLQLSDNGPGIPAEIKERIFEPFFTTRPAGTGLGLAVVQAVVQGHRGAVWVDSPPGDGCTFTLRLPVAAASQQTEVVP